MPKKHQKRTKTISARVNWRYILLQTHIYSFIYLLVYGYGVPRIRIPCALALPLTLNTILGPLRVQPVQVHLACPAKRPSPRLAAHVVYQLASSALPCGVCVVVEPLAHAQ